MKITFSKHITHDKIPLLKSRGFLITKKQIREVITNSDHLDRKSDYPKIIASKALDQNHVLRVVYKIDNDIIKAITVYPAEKGRYY